MAVLTTLGASSQARAIHVDKGIDLRTGSEVTIERQTKENQFTAIVFLSSKCPCSLSHVDEIKSLAIEYPDVRFLGVNSNRDETLEMGLAYFSKLGLSFPVLRDEKSVLADEMKALKTPHAFVVDRDRKTVFQGGVSNSSTFGRADRKYLREALEDIRQKRKIRTPLARTLGCAISR